MAIITNIKNRLNQIIYPRTLAEAVGYNNDTSELNANTVQGAIDEVVARVDGVATFYSSTITTTWSGSNPYTQELAVAGIKSTDKPIITPDFTGVPFGDASDILAAWADIYHFAMSANKITVYSLAETTKAVPVSIKVIR